MCTTPVCVRMKKLDSPSFINSVDRSSSPFSSCFAVECVTILTNSSPVVVGFAHTMRDTTEHM